MSPNASKKLSVIDENPPPKSAESVPQHTNFNIIGTSVVSKSMERLKNSSSERHHKKFFEISEAEVPKKRLSFAAETEEFVRSQKPAESSSEERQLPSAVSTDDSTDDSSSFSDSDEIEIEKQVEEKLTDAEGKVKIVKRMVKTYEKKSPPNIVEMDDDDDDDEYEEVEEEIEEEIEVEEEEEEEDLEEGEEDEEVEGKSEAEVEDNEIEEVIEKEEGSEELEEYVVEKTEEIQDEQKMSAERDQQKGEESLEEKEKGKGLDEEEQDEGREMEIEEISKQESKEEVEDHDQGEEKMGERKEQEAKESDLTEEQISTKPKRRKMTIKVIKKIRRKKMKEDVKKMDESVEKLEKTDSSSVIEREKMIELVKAKMTELQVAKKRNKVLQRMIIDYMKQRKMDSAYTGETPTNDVISRYYKKLKLLDDMLQAASAEKQRKLLEVNTLKENLQTYDSQYRKDLAELLRLEIEVGRNVIDSSTGKPLDESVAEHFVQRHEIILKQLSKVRLKLIKLQNQILIKESAFKNLVNLEGNLSLIEYEQLRVDNQLLADKIEERDEELLHLRNKMLAVIHTYAHVLEKSDSIVDDIEVCRGKLLVIDSKMNSVRERANKLKQYRDGLRDETRKMKRTAGLLIRPRLAIDFEDSVAKLNEGRDKLENLMRRFHCQKSEILELRKNIQNVSELGALYS